MSSERRVGKRVQTPCAKAVAAPLRRQTTVVGRRGVGLRNQEEQRTQCGSFVATYHTRVQIPAAAAAVIVLGSDSWLEKNNVKRLGTSLRGQTRVSRRRLGCSSPALSEVHSACLFVAQDTLALFYTLILRVLGSTKKVKK